jgi:hypothetical protein
MPNLLRLSREKLQALAELKSRGIDITPYLEYDEPSEAEKEYAEKYWNHFDRWILDCIVWKENDGPTLYQLEMARKLVAEKRIAACGPHGLGKTAWNSWLILWFATTRDAARADWKLPTTAGAWRQVTKFLWPEVHKWTRKLRWDIIGRDPFNQIHELQTLSLKLRFGEAFAVVSDRPDLIEGAHADQLLYIFDESKAIADATFDAAEGAFSNAGANEKTMAFAAACSTPGEPIGRFLRTGKPQSRLRGLGSPAGQLRGGSRGRPGHLGLGRAA